MKKILIFFIGMLFVVHSISGQNLTYITFDVTDNNGELLKNPFSGGLDTPQFSEVDLNNDGLLDLYVFDFTGRISSTYINTGSEYIYDPSYVQFFPEISYIVLLRDFDNDGAYDLFSYSGEGGLDTYKVYKGYFNSDDQLNFQEMNFGSSLGNFPTYFDMDGNEFPLAIENIVYPSIDDIDGDGDLDIVSIEGSGGYIKYYQNMSVENGWGLDSLYFVSTTECLGGALEIGSDLILELAAVPGECVQMLLNQSNNNLHGGYSLLTYDNDGDGDRDLLFGDKSFNQMNMLTNGGNNSQVFFTAQDILYPSNSTAIDVEILPAAFYIDADLDGEKDLIVSSRISSLNLDGYALYYKNTGTTDNPILNLVEEDWLVNTSIDFGKTAHPVFTDYNQDGLMDLVVGSQSIRINPGQTAASLFLYENIGSNNYPEFLLVDMDWLGMSSYDSPWLRPSFGDMDGDGDNDLLVGDRDGKLIYAENIAGSGSLYVFTDLIYEYMGIDGDINVGSSASPQIIDMDDDGQSDIIIGVRQGNIVFFKNIGTTGSPLFDSDPMAVVNDFQLGEVSVGFNANSIPFVLEVEGVKELYVGNLLGNIWKYENINNNLDGTFDLVSDNWEGVSVGEFSSPTFVDIDRNGNADLFIGNYRGGINAFETNIYVGDEVAVHDLSQAKDLVIFPNPVSDELGFSIDESIEEIIIYNSLGQVVKMNTQNVKNLSEGMYMVVVYTKEEIYVGKFIKK